MFKHSKALWRIEYRTDLTKASSPVLPLGYLLEARWNNDVRWMGMLFRKRLSPIELDRVDLETWPELKELSNYMKAIFDQAWDANLAGANVDAPQLGSVLVATNYGIHSSLYFASAGLECES